MFNPIEAKRRFTEAQIQKSFDSGINVVEEMDLEKAVYTDNAQNRKLGRVGQEYGGKGSRGGKKDGGSAKNQTFEAFYNQFKRDYKWNHPTATDMQVYDEAMKAYKKSKTTDAVASQTPAPRKSDPRDKIAQDGGFKDYEEMKGYQDYVTQKNLLKKKSTKGGMRLLYQQEVTKYEKDHADLIKRIGGNNKKWAN